jgi:hypothetical protein
MAEPAVDGAPNDQPCRKAFWAAEATPCRLRDGCSHAHGIPPGRAAGQESALTPRNLPLSRRGRTLARRVPLGLNPPLGKGRKDRLPHDQRPFGNRGQNPALDRPKIGGLNAVRTDLNCQSRPRLEQSDDWQRPHHRACHDPMRPPTRPA